MPAGLTCCSAGGLHSRLVRSCKTAGAPLSPAAAWCLRPMQLKVSTGGESWSSAGPGTRRQVGSKLCRLRLPDCAQGEMGAECAYSNPTTGSNDCSPMAASPSPMWSLAPVLLYLGEFSPLCRHRDSIAISGDKRKFTSSKMAWPCKRCHTAAGTPSRHGTSCCHRTSLTVSPFCLQVQQAATTRYHCHRQHAAAVTAAHQQSSSATRRQELLHAHDAVCGPSCCSLLGASHRPSGLHRRCSHNRVHDTHDAACQAGPCSLPGVSVLSAMAMPEVQSPQNGPHA